MESVLVQMIEGLRIDRAGDTKAPSGRRVPRFASTARDPTCGRGARGSAARQRHVGCGAAAYQFRISMTTCGGEPVLEAFPGSMMTKPSGHANTDPLTARLVVGRAEAVPSTCRSSIGAPQGSGIGVCGNQRNTTTSPTPRIHRHGTATSMLCSTSSAGVSVTKRWEQAMPSKSMTASWTRPKRRPSGR